MRAAKYRIARRSGGKVTPPKSDDASAVAKKPRPAPITVDGAPARMRLDRPMRKRADGGGISEDSKREAARLRERSDSQAETGLISGALGIGAQALGRRLRGVVPHGLTAAGLAGAYGGIKASNRNAAEADRIEKGLAKPGEEDRKRGGAVKKR